MTKRPSLAEINVEIAKLNWEFPMGESHSMTNEEIDECRRIANLWLVDRDPSMPPYGSEERLARDMIRLCDALNKRNHYRDALQTTRARLHSCNRPVTPKRLRIELRDMIDAVLAGRS